MAPYWTIATTFAAEPPRIQPVQHPMLQNIQQITTLNSSHLITGFQATSTTQTEPITDPAIPILSNSQATAANAATDPSSTIDFTVPT